ncbi:MAG: hypothetical protein PHS32_02315 [Rhodoferax sp.]|uniref:hypothetical protein n=1 Tax=Rhodoferax sp. TaxID=50421 RepID=UPI00262D44AD|nr:hypothetical protein [Rhodoferax sp.]MDD5332554.1 hypothetical protein [Rhodoferax sp.]
MKSSPLLLAISLLSIGAWAQPAPNAQAAASQSAPEQRRAELRQALRLAPAPAPARDDQRQEPALKSTPEKRHLSPQERADLRQQLRQQRPDARSDRP